MATRPGGISQGSSTGAPNSDAAGHSEIEHNAECGKSDRVDEAAATLEHSVRTMNKERLSRAFGARVRHLREEQDLSQEELAEKAGAHRNYVGGVERGEYNLSLESMAKIANGLGVHVADLVEGLPAYEPSPDDTNRRRRKRRTTHPSG